jgi:hypothetical protein
MIRFSGIYERVVSVRSLQTQYNTLRLKFRIKYRAKGGIE